MNLFTNLFGKPSAATLEKELLAETRRELVQVEALEEHYHYRAMELRSRVNRLEVRLFRTEANSVVAIGKEAA